MLKTLIIAIISISFPYYICSAQVKATCSQNEDLKSLQVITNDDFMLPSVIRLNSDDKIDINFDIIGDDMKWLSYKIIHCDINWNESPLSETEYLIGFNNNQFSGPLSSFNTFVPYHHYSLTLPNENIDFKISGNYKVEIYEDSDQEKILATVCFYILDNRINIASKVSSNTDIDFNKEHQQLEIALNWKNNFINSPSTDLKMIVKQNNRIDNQKIITVPSIVNTNGVVYSHNKDLIFEAGNTFRRMEFVSNKYAGLNVEKIIEINNIYQCILKKDMPRANLSFQYDQDQKGRFVIRTSEDDSPEIDADYYYVHFFLEKAIPFKNGDIFIFGDFTSNSQGDEFKMEYNEQAGGYEKSILLKQGHYNYQYIFFSQDNIGSLSNTEGNYYENNNEYLILVYYRKPGDRYDKLIGYNLLK
ncbi:MAG: DUF5103 domain-containing protein [Bacteroidales bacterium]|nr:DUF5103 domain-containing protein [Bacteroidales bacterium]